MDKKNIVFLYSIILFIIFLINSFFNVFFPAVGNNVIFFLATSVVLASFSYLYNDKKVSRNFAIVCTITFIFYLFLDINVYEKVKEYGLDPTLANYIIIIAGYGFKNFSLVKIFSDPGIFWYICFNFIIVYIINSNNKNVDFLKRKIKKSVTELKEIGRYREDIEKYEKTIAELQDKIVGLSSRTLVLEDAANQIGNTFEPKEIFNSVIEATVKLIDSDSSMIFILDRSRNLKISASHNIPEKTVKELKVDSRKGIIGMIMKDKNIITSEDIEKNFHLRELNKDDTIDIEMAAPIQDEDGHILALLVINKFKNRFTKEHVRMFRILLSITTLSMKNSKLFKKVEFMANVDGLTKLYTHRYFQEFLSEELSRAIRYKRPLSIIMSDIDHFKNFNDTYGHQTGDMVLEATAKIFKASVRNKVDLVARYGGEEFIAVLPETDMKSAFVVAERLRKSIEKATYSSETGEKLKVTASLGIAGFPACGSDKLELIKKADTAMYYAKENGRNQVQMFSPESMKIVEK